MVKILTFAGTRPEIIKLSQLMPLLDNLGENKFVFTGQHYAKNMVDIFLDEMGVRKPDALLESKSSEYSHLLPPAKKLVEKERPDIVIVYGDTNSTLAAAMAAKQNKVGRVVHIEAGLRSFDKRMAEETVRILVDHISDVFFPPTELASGFLEKEGITENKFVVGNTVVDACLFYSKMAEKSDILNRLGLEDGRFITSTIHRAENVDHPKKLARLLQAFDQLQYPVVLPVHHRTKAKLAEFGYKIPSNVKAIDPVGYFDILKLMKNSAFIITDSGGIQVEAVTLKIPCITTRETTERWETIEAGANFLVGTDPELIKYKAKMVVETGMKKKISNIKNPYGERDSSKKIASELKRLV